MAARVNWPLSLVRTYAAMNGSRWLVAAAMAAIVLSSIARPSAGSPAAAATGGAVYLPNVTKTLGGSDGWTGAVVLQNAGSGFSVEQVDLYRFGDGSLVATIASPSIAPGQAWTLDPLAYPALPDDTQFSAVVRPANGAAAAVVLEGSGASWMSYSGTAAGAPTVYLPNVLRRAGGPDGWNTPFIVQNVGAAATTASILFYRFDDGALTARVDGVTLAPGRAQPFLPWAIDGLQDGGSYSVVVQGPADAQLWAIANEHQGAEAMSYEGLLGGAERVYLPNVTKFLGGVDGWSTPVVVQNVGSATATLTLAFYAFTTGELALRAGPYAIDAGRSFAADVRFLPSGLAPGQYGVVVEGDAGAKLGAIVNEMDLAGRRAMSYGGATAGQPSAYLPSIRKGVGLPGWVSPVIAQNLGSAMSDLTITLFDGGGRVAGQRRWAQVAPGAAVVYDPRADPQLPSGTYSALVQAATAIAAVTNHTALALAGDYALAYGGTPGTLTAVPAPPYPYAVQTIGGLNFAVVLGQRADLYVQPSIVLDRTKLAASVDADVAQVELDLGQRFARRPQLFYFATAAEFNAGRPPVLGDGYGGDLGAEEGLYVPATGRIGINVASASRSSARHEITHAIVAQVTGDAFVPAWFNEGLARNEEYTTDNGYMRTEDRYSAASMAANEALLSLDGLTSPADWLGRVGSAAGDYQYDEAGTAVRLLRDDAGNDAPARVLALLRAGVQFPDAFARVDGSTYGAFAAAFGTRVHAIAATYPGIAATTGPDGTSLVFLVYGFQPLSQVEITVVWNNMPSTASISRGAVDSYGRWDQFVTGSSLSGPYTITVVAPTATATLTATKP